MRKTYIWPFIILVILNAVLIATLFLKPDSNNDHSPPPHIRQAPHERLNLDNEQHQAFRELAEKHKQTARDLNREQSKLIQRFIEQNLDGDVDTSLALLKKIEKLEADKVVALSAHFQDIRNLLTDEQIPYFQSFMESIIRKNQAPPKNPPPPRPRE